MEVLQAELKLVREDLHRVALELRARTHRAASLHAKHETIIAKHGCNAEDAERSQVGAHLLMIQFWEGPMGWHASWLSWHLLPGSVTFSTNGEQACAMLCRLR